jgi:positive phototaxis protein PixI
MSPTASASTQSQQFLGFNLAQSQAMLPTQQLTEILRLQVSQVVPIPDMLPSVLGVCNWRGEILWLVDLSALLGFQPLYTRTLRQGQVTIVIIHHQGHRLGLAVDLIHQMVWCDPQKIQPQPTAQITPELARCLQGYWSNPTGELVLVLDAIAILTHVQNSA